MTQILSPIDRSEVKHLETDRILYGTGINRANPAFMSPMELRDKGYRDGIAGMRSGNLGHDAFYNEGWMVGYSDRCRQQITDAGLTIVTSTPDLNVAVVKLKDWQDCVQAGEVAEIKFIRDIESYLVCVSTSLVERILPF